jgi:hypothetical protein
LDDAQIFVLWQDNWMHLGNVGNVAYARKWRDFTGSLKSSFSKRLPLLADE